jgi:iron complex transport system substrate-binding protein
VAVSNFDKNRPGTAGKPNVGDYQTIDWEKITPLHPSVLLVQYAADRFPPDLQQRCRDLNIQIVNVKLNNLDDIYSEMGELAGVIGQPEAGAKAQADLRAQLDAVRAQVNGKPAVSAVVVTDANNLDLAGPGNFLDDLLTIAGGRNAAGGDARPYFTVDREKLLELSPDVVIQLIPDGDTTPQVMEASRRMWDSLPDLPAVKNHRVVIITDWYAMQPGFRVGELAKKFADALHPEP